MRQGEHPVDVHDHLPTRGRSRLSANFQTYPRTSARAVRSAARTRCLPRPVGRSGGRWSGRRPPARTRLARPAARPHRPGSPRPARPRGRHPGGPWVRVVDGLPLAPGGKRGGYRLAKAGPADRFHQQHDPGPGGHPASAVLDTDMRVRPETPLHLGSASLLAANRTLSKSCRCRSGAFPMFLIKRRTVRFMKARG